MKGTTASAQNVHCHPAEWRVRILISHGDGLCLCFTQKSLSVFWNIFMFQETYSAWGVPTFFQRRFPAENVFDIYFGFTSALSINEKKVLALLFFKKWKRKKKIHHRCWHLPNMDGDSCRYLQQHTPCLSLWLICIRGELLHPFISLFQSNLSPYLLRLCQGQTVDGNTWWMCVWH